MVFITLLGVFLLTLSNITAVTESALVSLQNHLKQLFGMPSPSDIIDAIGGWTTKGIGHAYGKGYTVDILAKWMRKIDS